MTEWTVEAEDLFVLFLAALDAVVPEVTGEQRALVRDVVDGMIRERDVVPEPPLR